MPAERRNFAVFLHLVLKMHLGCPDHKWTALKTNLKDHQDAFQHIYLMQEVRVVFGDGCTQARGWSAKYNKGMYQV